jgi:type 1 glutamine amidotransferase
MAILRKFVEAGKPVVALRTSSHAWAPRGGKMPEGAYEAWKEFDRDVLGGNYTGHHGVGAKTTVAVAKGAEEHPVLKGVKVDALVGCGSLYKVSPLGKTAKPLLIGTVSGKAPEPVAWVNTTKAGGRVFYTSLGHVDDFKQAAFNDLLRNAVTWAAGKGE